MSDLVNRALKVFELRDVSDAIAKIVQTLHLRLRGMGKASPAGVCHLSPKVLMLDWPS